MLLKRTQIGRATPVEVHGVTTQAFHWIVAFAILAAWLLGFSLGVFPRGAPRLAALQVHTLLGLLVLTVAALRILWRLAAPAPAPVGPWWMELAARAEQLALYALTIGVPVLGLLTRWAHSGTATLPGGLSIPAPFALPRTLPWGNLHAVAAYLMAGLVGAHVAAALFHHLVLRDSILRRMVPATVPLPALPATWRDWILKQIRLDARNAAAGWRGWAGALSRGRTDPTRPTR